MSDTSLIDVRNVVKRFETVTAVGGLTFHVARGEIFALLGPNGAGKTTTIRMLVGIIRPDEGAIEFFVDGDRPAPPHPRDLGYLPEDRGLYRDVPVIETLVYFGVLRGMERKAANRAAREWLERMGLADRAVEKLETLSKGNQQKVQFVSAILHGPRLAVLDEPFSGLDPLNQELFLDILRELRAAGTTVLLSAHQMQLVERVADRLLILSQGEEVLSGAMGEIRRDDANLHDIYVRAVEAHAAAREEAT